MFRSARAGFTLVEFLIVIGILSLSIGSILLILTSVIKGTNQANINAEVKQNGQAVLNSIESQIRGANGVKQMLKGVLDGADSGLEIDVPNSDDNLYIVCDNERDTNGDTVSDVNGWIGVASGTSAPIGLNNYKKLTNDDLVNGTNIICAVSGSQAFQVNEVAASGASAVTIFFSAQQAINAPSRADFKAEAQFKTTISLRDYN